MKESQAVRLMDSDKKGGRLLRWREALLSLIHREAEATQISHRPAEVIFITRILSFPYLLSISSFCLLLPVFRLIYSLFASSLSSSLSYTLTSSFPLHYFILSLSLPHFCLYFYFNKDTNRETESNSSIHPSIHPNTELSALEETLIYQ